MFGCSPSYKQMQSAPDSYRGADVSVLQKFKPAFTVALYNTTVDVVGNHLSGLLLIKKMPAILKYHHLGMRNSVSQ